MSNIKSHVLGNLAESAFRFYSDWFSWERSVPESVYLPYDYAVRITADQGWQRVQCKHASRAKTGYIVADLRKKTGKTRGSYSKDEVDYFFVFCKDTDEAWLVPYEVAPKTGMTLNAAAYDQYKLKRSIVNE